MPGAVNTTALFEMKTFISPLAVVRLSAGGSSQAPYALTVVKSSPQKTETIFLMLAPRKHRRIRISLFDLLRMSSRRGVGRERERRFDFFNFAQGKRGRKPETVDGDRPGHDIPEFGKMGIPFTHVDASDSVGGWKAQASRGRG